MYRPREEIVALLLADYKEELENLTDIELVKHFQMSKAMNNMTDDEWDKAYQKAKKK